MLELVFLAAGLLALAAAIAVVLAQRTPAEHAQAAIRVGLLEPESRLDPPADLRPGMLGALIDGEVSDRDLKLTLLDLAARGYRRDAARLRTRTAHPAVRERLGPAQPARPRPGETP